MLNSNMFNFQFFLGGSTIVDSLVEGAKKFGGATALNGKIVSNIETDEFIKVDEKNNTVSVYVPSTVDVENSVDNTEYVMHVVSMIGKNYGLETLEFYQAKGSWYSDDMQKVVIENITVVTVNIPSLCENDVENFIEIAEYVKKSMSQEGVSLSFNGCLAIV